MILISVETIAIAAAVVSVLAAGASQLAYRAGEHAARPTHFGGEPIISSRNENSIRAGGARERAGRQLVFYQSAATSLLVIASLLQLLSTYTTKTVGIVALLGLLIVSSLLALQLLRWWREDRRLFVKMKYYIFHVPHEHLDADEIRRLFAEQHPTLMHWL